MQPKWESAASGSAPMWERAVSGNHAAAGATRCVANRSASLLLYCHCMIVRFALFRFVSLCFALFLLFRYFFVVFARRFSALGGGAKSAAVTSKVPESMPIVCLGTSAFEYRLRGVPLSPFWCKRRLRLRLGWLVGWWLFPRWPIGTRAVCLFVCLFVCSTVCLFVCFLAADRRAPSGGARRQR